MANVSRPSTQTPRLSPYTDWLVLRTFWMLRHAFPTVLTHWISLLKDTGALVAVGVAELTTVAKIMSESISSRDSWSLILASSAVLYLGATIVLVATLKGLYRLLNPVQKLERRLA